MAILFILSFFAAILGISLPGLINMTAAKISIKDGTDRAMSFVFGALLVIFFQTLIAIKFCQFIASNYFVLLLIRKIGFVLFVLLSIYFLFFAKKPISNPDKVKIKSKTSRFLLGIILSLLNFFPIPFYVYLVLSLSTAGYFDFKNTSIISFLMGVILGSFVMFYFYIHYFKKIESKTNFFLKNMNTIIGTITSIVSLLSLYKILN